MIPTIGILGGVGAIASARFHLDLVEAWAARKSAQTDNDFPIIRHISRPLGLTSEGLADREMTRLFAHWTLDELLGCDRIAVICNSITPLMLPWKAILTPVVACEGALRSGKSAWLVASDSTICDEVYQKAYPQIEWHPIPATSWIAESIKGHVFNPATVGRPPEGPLEGPIVLGCTELSTRYRGYPNVISPTDEMIKILCNL